MHIKYLRIKKDYLNALQNINDALVLTELVRLQKLFKNEPIVYSYSDLEDYFCMSKKTLWRVFNKFKKRGFVSTYSKQLNNGLKCLHINVLIENIKL